MKRTIKTQTFDLNYSKILYSFCSKDDLRIDAKKPFRKNDFIYATNCFMAIRIPFNENLSTNETGNFERIDNYFTLPLNSNNLIEMPILPKLNLCNKCNNGYLYLIKCDDCDGEGNFTHGCHEYDCKNCDGEGHINTNDKSGEKTACPYCSGYGAMHEYHAIGNAKYNLPYLYIISKLPNLRISNPSDEKEPLRFNFEGGEGVLLPVLF